MFLVVREFQLALNFALIAYLANLILMCVCEREREIESVRVRERDVT